MCGEAASQQSINPSIHPSIHQSTAEHSFLSNSAYDIICNIYFKYVQCKSLFKKYIHNYFLISLKILAYKKQFIQLLSNGHF